VREEGFERTIRERLRRLREETDKEGLEG